jgi:SAM-dependent methyltransferase
LDFDVAAITAARDRLGIDDVHAWSFDEYMTNRQGDKVDVLTTFEVLEHQEDPRGFLASCFALTRPGGYFAVSVPFRDRRPHWHEPWDQPPNHLTRWSKQALLAELSQAGYTTLEVHTGGVSSKKFLMFNVRFGIMSSRVKATSLAERGEASRGVAAATLLLRAKSAVLGGVGAVLDRVFKTFGATGIYLYVLAQRPED